MPRIFYANEVPRCATREQYQTWLSYFPEGRMPTHGFCTDCSAEYQARMIACGRCEHPEVRFDAMGDGYVPYWTVTA